jgi:predicted dithiol-disulfide oxidoreductase (DUF899 family)
MKTKTESNQIHSPKVVSRAEWLVARKKFLIKEKEFTRERDALNAERRNLPMVKIDKEYIFDSPSGKQTLADLFGGRSQLIVYHFMFGPEWKEGCPSCSFLSDHIDGPRVHLENHDVSIVAVSRAPLAKLEAFKKRMGWGFKWVSSYGNEFNRDFHVSFSKEEIAKGKMYYNYDERRFPSEEAHGVSVFYKNEKGEVFHTYSAYARGADILLGAYNWLDLTPKGRNESGPMDWIDYHDRYAKNWVVNLLQQKGVKNVNRRSNDS